uniref:Uncharacterized protein n=1 Tax=Ignisphaera aggregans TaxID=334771 RepID=A0A7C5UT71_9CREN
MSITNVTTVYETVVKPVTITSEKAMEKMVTVTETSPITVYQRVTEWSTAIALSIVLLVIGVVIGRFMMKRG